MQNCHEERVCQCVCKVWCGVQVSESEQSVDNWYKLWLCHSFCNKVKVIKTVISIISTTFNPFHNFALLKLPIVLSCMRSDALSSFVNSKWLTKLSSCRHLLSDGYSKQVEGITSYCYVMSSGQCHAIWQIIITSYQPAVETSCHCIVSWFDWPINCLFWGRLWLGSWTGDFNAVNVSSLSAIAIKSRTERNSFDMFVPINIVESIKVKGIQKVFAAFMQKPDVSYGLRQYYRVNFLRNTSGWTRGVTWHVSVPTVQGPTSAPAIVPTHALATHSERLRRHPENTTPVLTTPPA